MTPSLLVELSDDLPLIKLECFVVHEPICVLEAVQDKLVRHVLPVVVGMVDTARIFAGIDADKHRVTSLDSIAETGKERRCFLSLEVSQAGTEP